MCVILHCPKDVRPDDATLQACWDANPHGAGLAWRQQGKVHWRKTNDMAEIKRIRDTVKGELFIHFRIASVGGVCDELRHPFPVSKNCGLASSGSAKSVLFQNGTWSDWFSGLEFAEKEGHACPEGKMSDTRAAAFLTSIYGHRFLEKCGHSRWVYFSVHETATYGTWHKRNGIRFSNLYWLPYGEREERAAMKPVTPRHERAHRTSKIHDWANQTRRVIERDECAAPVSNDVIPGAAAKAAPEERELWDMSVTEAVRSDYWSRLTGKKKVTYE